MKSIIRIMTFASAAALLAAGCSREKIDFGGQEPSEQEVGYLMLPGMSVNTDAEIIDDNTRAVVNAPDDYKVTVTNLGTNEVAFTDTYGNIKSRTEAIPLAPGSYKIEACSPNAASIPVSAWNNPAYRGETSTPIEITPKNTTTLTDPVVCKLANIRVSVYLDEALKELFLNDGTNDVSTIVSLGDGPGEKFSRDETRSAYFKAMEENNTLRVALSGQYNVGTVDNPSYKPVSMTQNIPNVKAGQWRKISISVQHATEGNVDFVITVETFVNDETIDVDVMSSSYTFGEETIPDTDQSDPDSPAVTLAGGHNIASPFIISNSIFNDEGFCTDRITVNVAPQGDATVASIDAEINSDNEAFMSALASFNQTRSTNNTISLMSDLVVNGSTYVKVEDQGNGKLLTASSAAMKHMLNNYAGTHTVKFVVKDSQGRTSYTMLTIVVDAAAVVEGGPDIEWVGHDFGTRYSTADLQGTETVVINVTSKTGINGFLIDIISDVLSDYQLGKLGLSSHMDLINAPSEMAAKLQGLGFPTGDQVKGQTALSFNISQFMRPLAALGQNFDCDFKLTVTDESGTNAKTLMVHIPAKVN